MTGKPVLETDHHDDGALRPQFAVIAHILVLLPVLVSQLLLTRHVLLKNKQP